MASLAAVLLCRPHRPQDRRHHGSPLCPPQQGRRHLWPYRCPYRRRRLLCSAQSLHLLSHCPSRTHMGSTGSQRRAPYSLLLFLSHPPTPQEDPRQTLYFAHLFAADHVLSTAWTVFFTLVWWIWTPHDGRRQANSPAQEAMMKTANVTHHLTPAQRQAAAMAIWNHEKGTAAIVVLISWLFKVMPTPAFPCQCL